MNTSKTNVVLEVTNPMPKENLKQGLEQIFGAINGFMKWKYPNNHALDPEIKTTDVRSLLNVKGPCQS